MPDITTDKLRNVVLLSHSGAGKTVLAEAMLNAAGVTSRIGTIEDGTTASDFEPEEVRRQSSSQTAILPYPWRSHKINLLDTPGYADFRGEVTSAVRVADAAVVVVDGPSGVEVGTQQMWKLADERELPRIIFVSKMDRANADFARALSSITDRFGRQCIAVALPIGAESSFSGVVNLLDPGGEAPDSMSEEVEEARERLIEAVAEADDDLATKYLEGEELTQAEISAGLRQGVADGSIVPVLAGASPSAAGARELMDAIVDYLPSPADSPAEDAKAPSSGEETALPADPAGPLCALVFKTSADPFVGKLSFFRVFGGTFESDNQAWNATRSEPERVGQLFEIRGKEQSPVAAVVAGDIGGVSKLSSVLTGDTLGQRDNPLVVDGMQFPHSVYRMAVYPKSKADVDKMTSSLSRIVEEDPSISLDREPDTLEVLLGGLGDTHVDVAAEKIKRKFGVEILLETPKVAYKETISVPTTVEYKHKKQSGGHGQYGHVFLDLEPMERGAGFSFDQKIVGGAVPREYIPSVQKGIQKALPEGVVAGFPVIDIKATLVDGSFHSVDSSGIAFEIAGSHAITKGIEQARPSLLEPVMKAEITVPDEYAGDVMGDLNSRRGRIQGMVPLGDGTSAIEVEVPQAEMLRYATDLRSQTQGLGSFTIEFDHYEEVPQHLVARVVETTKEQSEARV